MGDVLDDFLDDFLANYERNTRYCCCIELNLVNEK